MTKLENAGENEGTMWGVRPKIVKRIFKILFILLFLLSAALIQSVKTLRKDYTGLMTMCDSESVSEEPRNAMELKHYRAMITYPFFITIIILNCFCLFYIVIYVQCMQHL